MGKASGFMEHGRESADAPCGERAGERLVRDRRRLPEQTLCTQGARCMDCGVPFLPPPAAPVSNLIPDRNDLVYRAPLERSRAPASFDQQLTGIH